MSDPIAKSTIKEYLENRKDFEESVYQAVGKADAEICAGLYKSHGKILQKIAAASFIEIAESCYFSKEELNLVQQGMYVFADFMKKADALMEIEAGKAEQQATDAVDADVEKESALDG